MKPTDSIAPVQQQAPTTRHHLRHPAWLIWSIIWHIALLLGLLGLWLFHSPTLHQRASHHHAWRGSTLHQSSDEPTFDEPTFISECLHPMGGGLVSGGAPTSAACSFGLMHLLLLPTRAGARRRIFLATERLLFKL